MKQFDYYEFAGVLAPGATLLFGLCILFPALASHLQGKEFTAGDFGVFVLLAYVAGQLIQALGNAIEWVWWKAWGGWPTEWPRTGKGHLLSKPQTEQLGSAIRHMLGVSDASDVLEIPRKDWMAVTRQIDAAVQAAGCSKRVETFNGNYGLNRGLAASLVTLTVLTLATQGLAAWRPALLLAVGCGIALYRMHRFARHYGRELLVQFLNLRQSTGGGKDVG